MAACSLTHRKQLDAESVHTVRAVDAESDKPVLGYSIGAGSSVQPRADEQLVSTGSLHLRTPGCYPMAGAIESTATTLPETIQKMLLTTSSERQGRLIDRDTAGSMEDSKRKGYF